MAPWSTEVIVTAEVHDGIAWLDISRFVVRRGGPVDIGFARQTALSTFDDGRMSLVLQNGTEDPLFTAIADGFGRSVTDGWGTADSGQAWSVVGGVAADYQVAAGVGTHSVAATSSSRRGIVAGGYRDVDIQFSIATDTLASGAPMSASAITRYVDGNNNYLAAATLETDQTVTATLQKIIGGTTTTLASLNLPAVTHTIGEAVRVRVMHVGARMRLRVWPASEDQPSTWHVEAADTDLMSPGDVGVRSFRNAGNTSGTTVFSYDDISVTDPLAGAGRFTSGYVNGPFYPWWREATRIRLRETVGAKTYDQATMFLEVPDVTEVLEDVDNLTSVSAVDQLARLRASETFASTLAAHIEANGGGTLVAYWPLNDPDHPITDRVSSRRLYAVRNTSTTDPTEGTAELLFNQGTGPRADDINPLALTSATDGASTTLQYLALSISPSGVNDELWSLEAGQTITIVVWVHPDWTRDESVTAISLVTDDGLVDLSRLSTSSGTAPGQWRISKPIGDLTGNVASGDQAASFMPYPIASRFGYDTNTLELWVGENDYQATLSGTLSPTPLAIRNVTVRMFEGSLSHLQVYVGDPDAFTIDDLAAQVEVGRHGHARQKTGDRIRMICNYAGVADGDLRLDPGVAYMQAAQLAGRKPRDELENAVRTEQGRLFCDGSGQIVFHDRRRIYNV